MAPSHDADAPQERHLAFLDLHPFVRSTAHDKVLGAVVGAALGDCIGLYTEFLPQTLAEQSYPDRRFSLVDPVTPFREDTHRDKFELTHWTDDTDHALLIILSYLHNNGTVSPDDVAARLRVWCTQGLRCLDRLPLGLGRTVGSVVLSPTYPTSPSLTALKHWLKSSRQSAANGSLMRTHPLGIICVPLPLSSTFEAAAEMSRITHVDPRCVLSCCVVTGLVRGLLRGEIVDEAGLDDMLERAWEWVTARHNLVDPHLDETDAEEGNNQLDNSAGDNSNGHAPRAPREENALDRAEYDQHVQAPSLASLEIDAAQKIGYVYKCLGSAVYTLRCAIRRSTCTESPSSSGPGTTTTTTTTATTNPDARISNPFEALLTDLVMHGGDADTNAAVAGALLGAWFGHAALPSRWRDGMAEGDWLFRKAEALSRRVGIQRHGRETGGDDPDTAPDGGRGFLDQKDMESREGALYLTILERQAARRERDRVKERNAGLGDGVRRWVRGLGLG